MKLESALRMIAENGDWRHSLIRHLVALEKEIATPGIDIREAVTGPIVDVLFDEDEVVRKTLSNGIILEFLYRSKIARDFVMSEPESPDHAWEPQTSRIVVELAKTAKQVVIGGAYFGEHAILIAREVSKNGGTVHAFEPNAEQRAMLRRNAELNGLTNIKPRAEGLWNDSTSSLKLVGYDSLAAAEATDASGDDAFESVTISDYLKAVGVDTLDLLVIDIEGAELAALQGAEAFLLLPAGQAPNILFEVHRHYVDWSKGLENTAIVRLLTDRGYQVFALRDFNSNVSMSKDTIELVPLGSIYLDGPPHGFNMLATKDSSIFHGELYSIVKDVSPKLLRHQDPALHHPSGGL